MPAVENQQSRPPPDADLEASWRAAKGDSSMLAGLWQDYGLKLLRVVSRVADSNEMDQFLDVALQTDLNAEQTVLEQSASAGNVAVFRHVLERMPEPLLGMNLRLGAIRGGVEIWRALLAYNRDCMNWEIGHHGDALGQAVLKRNTDLVRYLLSEGIDVQNSNFVGMPVLPAAKSIGASPEIIELLEAYGAPDEEV
ncbi:hypothetical protein LTR37_011829 [Vermiconidia calcicola]|uniref:Uncharacterized protein n=1 Tax=Vermiconidia calcicola TaxID=1690605 RepID=A0ACC3N123_9PEZI|nr:hypothetical protein LTR37_011829 [Vermiconidia calcicola]